MEKQIETLPVKGNRIPASACDGDYTPTRSGEAWEADNATETKGQVVPGEDLQIRSEQPLMLSPQRQFLSQLEPRNLIDLDLEELQCKKHSSKGSLEKTRIDNYTVSKCTAPNATIQIEDYEINKHSTRVIGQIMTRPSEGISWAQELMECAALEDRILEPDFELVPNDPTPQTAAKNNRTEGRDSRNGVDSRNKDLIHIGCAS
uniref:Uncharacterized protein n=1 Tax=Sphaerodactylus townsendi TaxID=933632 RepID=A0ACB8EB97_9SAUR